MDRRSLDKTQLASDIQDSHHTSSDDTLSGPAAWPEVDGYRIVRELGRGAMGIVYEAIQLSVSRSVALKTLAGLPDSQKIERFRTEAEAVARLQHPNIVQLYDFGDASGQPYFSLELVTGGSLDTYVATQRLSAREVAELIETLARAIHFAHEHHIVHRDLKPANILMTDAGLPKISDFGLAKRLDNELGETRLGDIVGTPHYMSPEQALSDSANIGPATDVYALGAVLYDLLVGEPPFSGKTILETLEKIRTRDPIPLRKRSTKIHADLETICLKCLQKDRRFRYPTALALAEDLRRYLDGEPVLARPITSLERTVRNVGRYPVVSALILAFVLGSTVALLTVVSQRNRFTAELDQFEAESEEQELKMAQQRLESDVNAFAGRALTLDVPFGLKPVPIPSDNPLTYAKVELGRLLFFDKRLSVDDTVSCATCHAPSTGWSDARPVATGVAGRSGIRNTPSIVNTAHQRSFFWDGRAENFEEQALGPLLSPIEMANPSRQFLTTKIKTISLYTMHFQSVFEDGVTATNISKALAAFERTIMAGNSPYDRFVAGEESALSESARRGMDLFFDRARCATCHSGQFFTDGEFHNIGLAPPETELADVGREAVTGLTSDRGSFKTPSLRDVDQTAPYMHNGSLGSLAAVVEHYDRGGNGHPQQDGRIFPIGLSAEERRDLVAFLDEGLKSATYPQGE